MSATVDVSRPNAGPTQRHEFIKKQLERVRELEYAAHKWQISLASALVGRRFYAKLSKAEVAHLRREIDRQYGGRIENFLIEYNEELRPLTTGTVELRRGRIFGSLRYGVARGH